MLKARCVNSGGPNVDAELGRQSLAPADLSVASVDAFDRCARSYRAADEMRKDWDLEAARAARYAGWDTPEGQTLLGQSLEEIAARVEAEGIQPEPRSGRQERLENIVSRFV